MQALLYSLRGSPKMRKILNKGDEMRGSLPGEICPSGQYELSHEAGLCQRRAVEVRDGLGGEGAGRADGRRRPKCGAVIDHLRYWRRVINSGEHRIDGFS
jgi:hypothetical protein